MSLIPEKCVECHDERRECVAYENGKKYTLVNSQGFKIKKVKVDKCLLQKKGDKRCDYLMSIEEKKRVIFIELKGGRFSDAVKQLCATIVYLRSEFKGYQIDARIVGRGDVPGIISTPDYRRLEREIGPNGTIKRATNNIYSENI